MIQIAGGIILAVLGLCVLLALCVVAVFLRGLYRVTK